MKLAQIFEATERSQAGTGVGEQPPEQPGISYEEMIEKMEGEEDGNNVVFIDDIEIKDPKNESEYDSCIVFEIGNIDHQAPHSGSAWSVDSDWDYYGYTDIDGDVIYWAHSLDEDGERWEIVKGSVELTERGQKQADEFLEKHFEEMKSQAEMDAAADRAGY